MADREKIIRFYKGTEGEEIVIKLIDAVEAVNKTRKFRATDFLDPYGCEIAETVVAHYDGISLADISVQKDNVPTLCMKILWENLLIISLLSKLHGTINSIVFLIVMS